MHSYRCGTACLAMAAALACSAYASSAARLSFEELTDTSDLIAAGQVNRSWAAWDGNHKYIWTHYTLAVSNAVKGRLGAGIEFAEPGGTLDGIVMSIPGAAVYQQGERVFVFLQKMPNGYLRTTGLGQGRYSVDAGGKLHAGASAPQTLDGMSVTQASSAVAARGASR